MNSHSFNLFQWRILDILPVLKSIVRLPVVLLPEGLLAMVNRNIKLIAEGIKIEHSKISIIDTHAHLDADEFASDCDAVIARAVEAGVNRIITAGTSVESSKKAIALAEKYPQVFAAVGIHPQEIAGVQKTDIRQIAELAKHPKVVALGEMGLDFHRSIVHKEEQIQGTEMAIGIGQRASPAGDYPCPPGDQRDDRNSGRLGKQITCRGSRCHSLFSREYACS